MEKITKSPTDVADTLVKKGDKGRRASSRERTMVIVLAELVVIVALIVLWSMRRAKHSPK